MNKVENKKKNSIWYYLGLLTQILMWVAIFILLFTCLKSGFDFSEFRYVGF